MYRHFHSVFFAGNPLTMTLLLYVATLVRGKYYYYFMVNCEPSFGKMNLFHTMSDP